ncbi:hypothetical protein GJU43_05160 [Flavobacterium sp. LC2016-23]|uniref:hypothetical protein n=1 Tax=Flavobacterium sp. LC2016-23 TaxID=2666330 RepID=UPI0012B055EB|nr:hypothetical protein [Flavobacterium sp. LC2016-23]MRX38653.1 hypothetical protein [Flavobacterium sp. LC2016-23]
MKKQKNQLFTPKIDEDTSNDTGACAAMAISHKLLVMTRSKIGVESNLNSGSVFYIEWPFSQSRLNKEKSNCRISFFFLNIEYGSGILPYLLVVVNLVLLICGSITWKNTSLRLCCSGIIP